MHLENHNKSVTESTYLIEFESEVARLTKEHLSKIVSCPSKDQCLTLLASRLVTIFVRHAALVRPLSEEGKLKLAQDMATIEMTVTSVSPIKCKYILLV